MAMSMERRLALLKEMDSVSEFELLATKKAVCLGCHSATTTERATENM